MKAADPKRPGLENGRPRSLRAWLLQEGGLILLAVVLAVILWEITSTRVIRDQKIPDVRVVLEIADEQRERIAAFLDDPKARVTIELRCSDRERRAVVAALTEAGGGKPTLKLRVREAPSAVDASRPINDQDDHWNWPVRNAVDLNMSATMPGGDVYAIRSMQQVHIALPSTKPSVEKLKEDGFALVVVDPEAEPPTAIRLDRAFMEFRAPRILLGDGSGALRMAPDAINLDPILRDGAPQAGKPQTHELSFHEWKQAADVPDTLRAHAKQCREKLPLVPVTARLVLARTAEAKLEHRLDVLVPPGMAIEPEQSVDDVILDQDVPLYRGRLQGPKAMLDEIASDNGKKQWMWAVWVDEPAKSWPQKPSAMMSPEDKERTQVTARIVWVTTNEAWKRAGVRFVPEEGSLAGSFTVRVYWRKPN